MTPSQPRQKAWAVRARVRSQCIDIQFEKNLGPHATEEWRDDFRCVGPLPSEVRAYARAARKAIKAVQARSAASTRRAWRPVQVRSPWARVHER